MKKIFEVKPGHGWFGGYFKQTECERINRERERVPIVDNTKMGYTMASDGDGIDLGLHRKNHRGTVKHGISHTIKTECDAGVIEIERV